MKWYLVVNIALAAFDAWGYATVKSATNYTLAWGLISGVLLIWGVILLKGLL